MENISKILDAISAEGRAEADKIRTAGAKSAEEIRKLYQEEASIEEESILKKARKEAEEILQRGSSQAGITSRNIRLTARRQALEDTFTLALERMMQLPDKTKQDLYAKLIGTYTGGTEVTVQLNQADSETLGKKLVNKAEKNYGIKVTVGEEPGAFLGGLILREGEIETNCTFEVMIQDTKKEKESEIAAVLFA